MKFRVLLIVLLVGFSVTGFYLYGSPVTGKEIQVVKSPDSSLIKTIAYGIVTGLLMLAMWLGLSHFYGGKNDGKE